MIGFWIFMMIINLLIPVTMIVFAKGFRKMQPGNINSIYGYRTNRSMKNEDTWVFAHRCCGRLWTIFGRVTLVSTIILMMPLLGKSIELVGKLGGIICAMQLVILISSVYITEKELKKTFDKDGNRI